MSDTAMVFTVIFAFAIAIGLLAFIVGAWLKWMFKRNKKRNWQRGVIR